MGRKVTLNFEAACRAANTESKEKLDIVFQAVESKVAELGLDVHRRAKPVRNLKAENGDDPSMSFNARNVLNWVASIDGESDDEDKARLVSLYVTLKARF